MQLAQQLYEKFKVITYPRTDSRYLPEDYIATVKSTLGKISDPTLAKHARTVLDKQWVKPTKRIFNNAKISDHFAIVPSGQIPHGLDEVQEKIYDMIVRRFISVFFPAAQFEITARITRIEKDALKTDGKVIIDPAELGLRYPAAIGLEADAGVAIEALLAALAEPRHDRPDQEAEIKDARAAIAASARAGYGADLDLLQAVRAAIPAPGLLVSDLPALGAREGGWWGGLVAE